jgi:serine protease Do
MLIVTFIATISLVAAGCQASPQREGTTTSPVPTSSDSNGQPLEPISVGDFQASVRQVVQKVKPAVVQITSQQVLSDQFDQPFTVPGGVGSGVIYDDQGHILTNDHVIEGAEQLVVSLPDGRTFTEVELVGRDPQTDLAVLQISGDDLSVADLGDSDRLQVGDWVVTIGNALALPGGPTVTTGVVSALDRTVQEPGGSGGEAGPYLFDAIQTDAPINPGNSGGPLVNLAGEVVGINTLVAGQAEAGVQAEGIGFAIAINTAKPIADELVATGEVAHPFLGIGFMSITPGIAAQLGVDVDHGVVVQQVQAGSPAAEAGLERLDVITEVDGAPLTDESALPRAISERNPGDTVRLTVLRNGQSMNLDATLRESPPA